MLEMDWGVAGCRRPGKTMGRSKLGLFELVVVAIWAEDEDDDPPPEPLDNVSSSFNWADNPDTKDVLGRDDVDVDGGGGPTGMIILGRFNFPGLPRCGGCGCEVGLGGAFLSAAMRSATDMLASSVILI
eukprot:scaffold211786_cov30-Attheya_sp.AAC.1